MTLISIVAFLMTASPFASQTSLSLHRATPNATEVGQYQLFELSLDLKATYDNPFDPADIDVYAQFEDPDGKVVRVNGFFTQKHKRILEKGGERIEPEGTPFWQIRFAPPTQGTWRYRVSARDRSGTTSLPEAQFNVTASANPGYVRRDVKSPNLFALENGNPLFLIGENMCWPGARGTFDYEDWLSALSQGGGNWIRLWMHRWSGALEWSSLDKKDWETSSFGGLGVYHLGNAWKVDTILDTAEKQGVYVMLCLGTYGEFTEGGFFNEGLWKTNPYNAANGGPCKTPEEFWTNETARKFYKQRLRYIAARYGWRSNLFAWEFWNEAKATPAWISEMAHYLKGGIDPVQHLVSTTYGTDDIWKIPEIDFTMTHTYGEGNVGDISRVVNKDAARHWGFGKPHLMAEFGIDWRSSDDKYDTTFQGINLHNALWASTLSLNAGGAMIWYWDSYVHPGKLYGHYAALHAYTRTVPWAEGPWRPVKTTIPPCRLEKESWRDLVLNAAGTWGKSAENEFDVLPVEGVGDRILPGFLYGDMKPELRTPLKFHVDYPTAGRFEFKVNSVSTQAHVNVTVDENIVLDKSLSADPVKAGETPEYASTKLRPEYNSYQATFNKSYGVDVAPGKHTISVSVLEGDWVSIAEYRFTQYTSNRFPPMDLYGITNGHSAYVWVQNNAHTWLAVKAGEPITPIQGAQMALHDLPTGSYTVTWWDTWEGKPIREEQVNATDSGLVLTLPELKTDVAVAVKPVKP